MVYSNLNYANAVDAVPSGALTRSEALYSAPCGVHRLLRPSLGKSVRWLGLLMIGGFALAVLCAPSPVVAQVRNSTAGSDVLEEVV